MKKIFIPLMTVVVVVSIVFAGCVPAVEPAPPVTPPPVTPPPVTPPPVEPPPVTPPVVEPPAWLVPPLVVPVYPEEVIADFIAKGYGDDYYLAAELVTGAENIAFCTVISAPAEPIVVHKRFRIAVIAPSLDLSDAWYSGWKALEGRLEELGIPAIVNFMGTGGADHEKMAGFIDAAIAAEYDYIIVAPTELKVMKEHLEAIMDAGIPLIVWNNTTPFRDWGTERRPDGQQPLAWINFDHGNMGLIVGMKILEYLPENANIVLLRGVPGVVDWNRSDIPRTLFELAGHNVIYEHVCDWSHDPAYEGTLAAFAAHHPDPGIDHVYCASSGISFGAVAALKELGLAGEILVNGQGGGPTEFGHMFDGNLYCTAFRMQDDWGVALAEVIKYHIMDRMDEVPLVIIPPTMIADMTMTPADIAGYTAYAYRYSGVLEY